MKPFLPNREYFFDLEGNCEHQGVFYARASSVENDVVRVSVGNQTYNLSRIWLGLICHYEVDLSMEYLSRIDFVHVESRIIKLKCKKLMIIREPISVDENFYVIPGFTRFCIDRYGNVKSIRTNRILSQNIGPYGYPCVAIYDPDKSRWRNVSVHILLARTFVKNKDPELRVFVNHKDGNKLNFSLKNLEWVTSRENQKHAIETGLRQDNKPCRVYDVVTKEVTEYPSVGLALEKIGLKIRSTEFYRRDKGRFVPRLFLGRYEIKDCQDQSDWFYSSEENLDVKPKSIGPFQAKCLETDEVFEAATIKELAKLVGVSKYAIEDILKSSSPKSKSGFLFRSVGMEWPVEFEETRFCPPRTIKVSHLETGEVRIFSSLRQACLFTGADKRTLKDKLRNRKPYNAWIVEELSS